jgi:hypothetical protein
MNFVAKKRIVCLSLGYYLNIWRGAIGSGKEQSGFSCRDFDKKEISFGMFSRRNPKKAKLKPIYYIALKANVPLIQWL